MGMLQGFPLRNQLAEPTQDGQGDENKYENCLPCSLAAAVTFLTGKIVYGDTLKDKAYGQGHIGGGSGRRYVPIMPQYGVWLDCYNGPTQASLIDKIKSEIDAGHPVIVTMPSAWGIPLKNPRAYTGGSHCGAAYAYDATTLTVANPWRGFAQRETFGWWEARLLAGQVWPVSRLAGAGDASQPVGVSSLPDGWQDDGTTLVCANGQPVVKGFRAYVLAKVASGQWQGGNAYGPEWGDEHATRQLFADALLEWTPATGVVEGSLADALALAEHLREGKAA